MCMHILSLAWPKKDLKLLNIRVAAFVCQQGRKSSLDVPLRHCNSSTVFPIYYKVPSHTGKHLGETLPPGARLGYV